MVLRGRGGATTFGLAAAISAFLVGDALVRGDWALVLRSLGVVSLVLWTIWVLLVRPSLRIADDALTVVNVLRVVRLPWSEVDHVAMRYQISIETTSGGTVRCWGGPSLPRPKPARRGEVAEMPRARELDVLRDALDRHREAGAGAGAGAGVGVGAGAGSGSGSGSAGAITRTWDTVALGIGAASLLAAVLALTVR